MNSEVTSGIVGTAPGMPAGAAFGGGSGAAIGAGRQQRYDAAFIQCIYAKGHQVPVLGQFSGEYTSTSCDPYHENIPLPHRAPPPAPPN